jgi:ABC-type multidrug transport system fused ATPase/permease subunit
VELQDWAGQKQKIKLVEGMREDNEDSPEIVVGDEEDGLGVVSKYAKVNQPCPFSKHPPQRRFNLEWRDINYKVVFPVPPENLLLKLLLKLPIPERVANLFKAKKEVPILNNVSGRIAAGQVVAIMGPTGSGKTTLLNVLARRIKSNVTGDILINGEPVKGRRLKRRMAYVLQDDIFFPHLTVRDTVTYTAYLKLSKSLSWQEKRDRVEDILTELGIQRCSNTIVGGGWVVRATTIQ